MPMTCVTLARVIPSRRAIAAWFSISPASICRRHSAALARISAARWGLGFLGGLGTRRGRGTAVTTRPVATRRVTAPTLAVSNARFGPRATSTVWSQEVATGAPTAKW